MPILVRASAEIEASITTAIELKMKKSTSYGGAAATFPGARVTQQNNFLITKF